MSLRRFLLLPFAMLALAFTAAAPASAFERSHDAYEMSIVAFDLDLVLDLALVSAAVPVTEPRAGQSVILERTSTPADAALGPIYALSLKTDGQSLVHPPHRGC